MAHSRQGPLKSNLRFAYGSRNSMSSRRAILCPPSLTQPALYVEARARKCAMQTVKWDQARCWYCTSMHMTQWWFGMLWSKDMVTSQASWLPAKKALESTVCTKNPTMALGVQRSTVSYSKNSPGKEWSILRAWPMLRLNSFLQSPGAFAKEYSEDNSWESWKVK